MTTGATTHEPRILLRKASWLHYVSLRDADENQQTRMTFDRGSLELKSPTGLHERLRILIGKCIDAWAEERGIPIQSRGSATFRREDLERGLEPDNCYYIRHESVVRQRDEIDLTIDPPPDLAIEVDITSSSIDRLSIYAGLGVPEVWRWHDDALQILVRDATGHYAEAAASEALPGFPCQAMAGLIGRRTLSDETTLIREFRGLCRATPR